VKLVITYTTTDGYTYSNDHILPIEYESPEALLLAFDEAIQTYQTDPSKAFFQIGAHHFEAWDFREYRETRDSFAVSSVEHTLPNIYTLEEWFEKYSK